MCELSGVDVRAPLLRREGAMPATRDAKCFFPHYTIMYIQVQHTCVLDYTSFESSDVIGRLGGTLHLNLAESLAKRVLVSITDSGAII